MKNRIFFPFLSVILLWIISAHATTMFELGLQELATGAEKVVQAKVAALVTQWDKDSTVINTYIRMNIIDDMIGDDEDNEIIIKCVGGQIGNLTLEVEGSAHYQVGEEDVLFLFQDPENVTVFQTLGMFQGKYKIFIDENKVRRVARDTAEAASTLYKRASGAPAIETGNNYTLEEFKSKVLEYISSETR